MMDGVLEHVPSARISVVGIYRNEETLEPVPYFQKLASDLEERLAIVVDPMLATGGSMISTIDLLKSKRLPTYQSISISGGTRRNQSIRKSTSGY